MSIENTDAFVISSIKFKESDRILNFFTQEEELLSVIAKGTNRGKGSIYSSLGLLDYCQISYFKKEGKEMFSISSVDSIKSIGMSEMNIETLMSISIIVELIKEFCPKEESNSEIFSMLSWIHEIFKMREESKIIIDIFMLKMLYYSGFVPQIDSCSMCFQPIKSSTTYCFSNSASGLFCNICNKEIKVDYQ